MQSLMPGISSVTSEGAAVMTLTGDWVAENAAVLETLSTFKVDDVRSLRIDARKVTRLDTFGAWAIDAINKSAAAAGVVTEVTAAGERYRGILTNVARSRLASSAPATGEPLNLTSLARSLGEASDGLFRFLSLVGRLASGVVGGFAWRTRIRWTSVVHHLDRVGLQATPIIALMTFLIGCIIAQQGFFHFERFGARDYVVDLLTILVLREIGVLLVAIMVAGRSGSAYTAEIGSMKMREEIDALRTMGLDPVNVLVLPRVVAIVLALPILTFLGVISAMMGGLLVAVTYGDMSAAVFFERLRDAATYDSFLVGMIKAPVMALVIGAVAAHEGLQVEGSAESLGRRATSSVVKSIFLVIVLDGLFAVLFAWAGM